MKQELKTGRLQNTHSNLFSVIYVTTQTDYRTPEDDFEDKEDDEDEIST